MGGVVEIKAADSLGLLPKSASNAFNYAMNNAFAVVNPIGDYIVKNYDLPSGNLLTLESHIVGGVAQNSNNMVHGAVTGNWVEFRSSVSGLTSTAVGVIAVIVGAVIGWFLSPVVGYPIMAAGFVLLDAQYNNGDTLRRNIAIHAEIEKVTTHTNYIERYSTEIQMLSTMVASVVASYGVGYGLGYIGVTSYVQANIENWNAITNIINAGYGGYETYSAIQAIRESQAYWEEQLRIAEEYYRKILAQAQAAKDIWFTMMSDPDFINRILAGGDLFSMGAGHDLWSMTSVAEPKYALGLIDRSDVDMDRLINNRYYEMSAGSDWFKIQ